MKKIIAPLVRVIITYLKYGKSVKGWGVIIKRTKINGSNNKLGNNVILVKTVIEQSVFVAKGSVISASALAGYNKIGCNCNISNSKIGEFSYVADNASINFTTIGKFCSVGPNFKVGLGSHPVNFISSNPLFYKPFGMGDISLTDENLYDEYKQTIIGHDVWIGANVVVLDGIKIGNGAIIGAGSIVTKDIADYAVVGGAPAHFIKYRFNLEVIEILLKMKWWDKDMAWLKANIKYFTRIINGISDLDGLV